MPEKLAAEAEIREPILAETPSQTARKKILAPSISGSAGVPAGAEAGIPGGFPSGALNSELRVEFLDDFPEIVLANVHDAHFAPCVFF